jgi:hypothetical protein
MKTTAQAEQVAFSAPAEPSVWMGRVRMEFPAEQAAAVPSTGRADMATLVEQVAMVALVEAVAPAERVAMAAAGGAGKVGQSAPAERELVVQAAPGERRFKSPAPRTN